MAQIRCAEAIWSTHVSKDAWGFPCLWSDYNSMPGMSCIACSSRDLNNFPAKSVETFKTAKSEFTPVSLSTLHGVEDDLGTNQTSRRRNALAAPQYGSYCKESPNANPLKAVALGPKHSLIQHTACGIPSVKRQSLLQSGLTTWLCFFFRAWCADLPVFWNKHKETAQFSHILARPSTNISFSPNVWSIFTTNCCHCFQTEGRVYISTMYSCWCGHNIVSETVRDSQKIRAASIC